MQLINVAVPFYPQGNNTVVPSGQDNDVDFNQIVVFRFNAKETNRSLSR